MIPRFHILLGILYSLSIAIERIIIFLLSKSDVPIHPTNLTPCDDYSAIKQTKKQTENTLLKCGLHGQSAAKTR
ncbi:hypothetical protein BDV18DRAFT_75482 [Aspergillus unguis]